MTYISPLDCQSSKNFAFVCVWGKQVFLDISGGWVSWQMSLPWTRQPVARTFSSRNFILCIYSHVQNVQVIQWGTVIGK